MFDLDYLTNYMNYMPVVEENQASKTAGPQETNPNAGSESSEESFVLPLCSTYSTTAKNSNGKFKENAEPKPPSSQLTQKIKLF